MQKKQDTLVPVFGALCFFLSAIEFVIPKPLPFMRIGLANVPLMLALDVLSFPAFLLLAVIKIFGQAFISGTLFSYLVLFSAAGTLGAAFTMYALHSIPRKLLSLAGIGMAGAFVSNSIQLFVGRFFVFGKGIWYMLPPFLCIGAITSIVLGIFCENFKSESEWYAQITRTDSLFHIQLPDAFDQAEHPWFRLASGFILLIALLFIPGLPAKTVILAAGLLLCIAERAKNTLDCGCCFYSRYRHLSQFYSDRQRIVLYRPFPDYSWRVIEWSGKSGSAAGDDCRFPLDAPGAYPPSGTLGQYP